MMKPTLLAGLLALVTPLLVAQAETPAAVAVAGAPFVTLHAEGAQIYECRADSAGKLAWQFREPIATLILDGKTVGRHYAGPTWELSDGGAVTGKVAASAPGATAADIAVLKLDVATRRGSGMIADATLIQRLNTRGGAAQGACETVGALTSVAYSADYAFHK
jgi:hypothetical protein